MLIVQNIGLMFLNFTQVKAMRNDFLQLPLHFITLLANDIILGFYCLSISYCKETLSLLVNYAPQKWTT